MTTTQKSRLTAAQRKTLAEIATRGATTGYGQNWKTIGKLQTLGLVRYADSREVNAALGRDRDMQGGYVLTDRGREVAGG